jgi:hypothetical protein
LTVPPQAVGQGKRPNVPRPWPRLPLWFRAGVAVAFVAFLAVAALALKAIVGFEEQPLFERRSPSAPGAQSHDVGRVELPDAPLVPVRCRSVDGLRVQGGPESGPLLAEVLAGLCKNLNTLAPYDAVLAERMVALARAGAIVSFANFGRTGELSTTVPGPPPRILLSDSFLRGAGQFKGFLLPVLAHEAFHGGSTDVSADDELTARRVELVACGTIPSREAFRGCSDAKGIVETPDAVRKLREVGYR